MCDCTQRRYGVVRVVGRDEVRRPLGEYGWEGGSWCGEGSVHVVVVNRDRWVEARRRYSVHQPGRCTRDPPASRRLRFRELGARRCEARAPHECGLRLGPVARRTIPFVRRTVDRLRRSGPDALAERGTKEAGGQRFRAGESSRQGATATPTACPSRIV